MNSNWLVLGTAAVWLGASSAFWPARGDIDQIAGKALFERIWVAAPSSTDASDGLGPLFNARSCSNCHKDGGPARLALRPDGSKDIIGAVVRFGDKNGRLEPNHGLQLQTDAVPGLEAEGTATFYPSFSYELKGAPLVSKFKAGVRLAPSLYGRAAFDLIGDDAIRALADPADANGDGISGRMREIQLENGAQTVGRFGWKAAQPTLVNQIAHAFNIDIGLSSPLMPFPSGDCTELQPDCQSRPNGESRNFENREISLVMLTLVADYHFAFKPSAQPQDEAARDLFNASGCPACHVPTLPAGDGRPVRTYSDFLLHDMGPELDDGVGEPGVASAEWRTAPLIDIGPRGGERRYMHDGRAASVAAAVEAHGGEATAARDAFRKLSDADRQRLISYLEAL